MIQLTADQKEELDRLRSEKQKKLSELKNTGQEWGIQLEEKKNEVEECKKIKDDKAKTE